MKPYHVGHRISVLGRLLSKRLQERISGTGLTSSQWPIIARLIQNSELTQIEICEQLSIEAPAISKTICNMEAAGWVRRVVDANDKREKKVTLTEKARQHLPIWLKSITEMENQALHGITKEDFAIFNRVLEKMLENQKQL